MTIVPGQLDNSAADYFGLDKYQELLGRLEQSRADVRDAKAARRASTSQKERKERGKTVREMKAKRRRIKNRILNRD